MFLYSFVNITTTLHFVALSLIHRVQGMVYPRVGWFYDGLVFNRHRRHVSLILRNALKSSRLFSHVLKGRCRRRLLVVMATVTESGELRINLYRPVKAEQQSGLVRIDHRLAGEGAQFEYLMKDGNLIQPCYATSQNWLHQIGYFPEDPLLSYRLPLTDSVQRELRDYIDDESNDHLLTMLDDNVHMTVTT